MIESIEPLGHAEEENCSFYYQSDYESELAVLLSGRHTVQTSMPIFVL